MDDKEFKAIADEMGENGKEYIKEYVQCKLPKNKFIDYFREYLDTRAFDEEGYKQISPQTFTYFLLDKLYGSKLDDGFVSIVD